MQHVCTHILRRPLWVLRYLGTIAFVGILQSYRQTWSTNQDHNHISTCYKLLCMEMTLCGISGGFFSSMGNYSEWSMYSEWRQKYTQYIIPVWVEGKGESLKYFEQKKVRTWVELIPLKSALVKMGRNTRNVETQVETRIKTSPSSPLVPMVSHEFEATTKGFGMWLLIILNTLIYVLYFSYFIPHKIWEFIS